MVWSPVVRFPPWYGPPLARVYLHGVSTHTIYIYIYIVYIYNYIYAAPPTCFLYMLTISLLYSTNAWYVPWLGWLAYLYVIPPTHHTTGGGGITNRGTRIRRIHETGDIRRPSLRPQRSKVAGRLGIWLVNYVPVAVALACWSPPPWPAKDQPSWGRQPHGRDKIKSYEKDIL